VSGGVEPWMADFSSLEYELQQISCLNLDDYLGTVWPMVCSDYLIW
jgi:hypothetical protein